MLYAVAFIIHNAYLLLKNYAEKCMINCKTPVSAKECCEYCRHLQQHIWC